MTFDELPRTIPIFPLAGALLLPGGRLPLNIFEPRYLQMTRDAMAGGRIIGMIQPLDPSARAEAPEIYRVGCLGRIASFSETEDGRFLITLAGVVRFSIVEELSVTTPYRQVLASYARYRGDLNHDDQTSGRIDRTGLLAVLKDYFPAVGLPVDWQAIEDAPTPALVTTLCIVCPFDPAEKQALLEAPTFFERTRLMQSMMVMAAAQRGHERPAGGPKSLN